MSTVKSTVNNVSYFTFASPRYNTNRGYSGNKIPNDYSIHDSENGTFDKWFPLYRLTSTPEPVLEIVNQEGSTNIIKNTLAIKLSQSRYLTQQYGAIKGTSERPFNSNLEKQAVTYNQWSSIRLNPAWTVIQTRITEDSLYTPLFLVRILGSTEIVENIHVLKIDGANPTERWSSTEFPKGIYVSYKNRIWKCLNSTSSYPPVSKDSNTNWQLYSGSVNVFNVDLFYIDENGNSEYFMEINDDKRKFIPSTEKDDLVCWNLAYYE